MSTNDLPSVVDPALSGGTTTPAAADPATPGTTASETADERAARLESEVEELRSQKSELLRMKSNAEETARENERLRSQLTPPTAGPDVGQYAARIQRAQMRWQQIASDPNADEALKDDALALLAIYGAAQQTPQQLMQRIDLLEVPKDERADVERIQQERFQRGERISADTAKELLKVRRLEAEAARVQKQADELRRAQEAKERGVVQTRTVGIPASEAREGEMTYSQFRQAWANATPEQQEELRKKTGGGTKLKPG